MKLEFLIRAAKLAVIAGCAVFTPVADALAQNADQQLINAETRRASVEQTLQARDAAISAMSDPSCPVVTYADVLAAPDDTALNVCFARTQINEGNVRGAVATLERVLLIAPDALNVRLLYAVVLFRLDNIDEAEREFQNVAENTLPPEIRRQVDQFLDQIQKRRQRTKHSVTVSVGGYADTNRNSAPASEELEAAGARNGIALKTDRQNDALGLLTIVSYDFTHDPGLQNQHEIFGGVDIYGDTMSEQNKLDIQSLGFDAGVRLRYPGITITPRVFLTNMRLGWEKFYQSEGVELRVDHKHKLVGVDLPLLDVWASVSAQDEDFHNTTEFGTLTLRNGNKYTSKIGFGMLVHPEHHVALVGTAEYKNAAIDAGNSDRRTFAYKYYNAEASHTWILGDGHFLLSNVLLGTRQYKVADALVVGADNRRRLEQPFRLRATYGMPLTDIIGGEWLDQAVNSNSDILDIANGTTISFMGEHNYQRSNITNFQYTNSRVQVLLTRRFE